MSMPKVLPQMVVFGVSRGLSTGKLSFRESLHLNFCNVPLSWMSLQKEAKPSISTAFSSNIVRNVISDVFVLHLNTIDFHFSQSCIAFLGPELFSFLSL